jgi:hypothetical protein
MLILTLQTKFDILVKREIFKMSVLKRLFGLLAIVLVICLAAGCLKGPSDDEENIFSYTADDLAAIFNTEAKTVTMNKWFSDLFSWMRTDYDAWVKAGNRALYKDKALSQEYQGSDLIQANSAIYSDFSLNGQGPKIGTVTGTIKLTDIPSEQFKLYLFANAENWDSQGTVTLINPVEKDKDMNWSFPVYSKQVNNWGTFGFEPSETEFTLLVLSEKAQKGYEVPVTTKRINSSKENVGSLGTISIKGVQLSGTINVTYNGEPVPYIEIYANWAVQGTLETTYLLSPGPNAPWSILLEKSSVDRDITFKIFGTTKQDYAASDIIIDRYASETVYVSNSDVSNIVIDL